MTGSAEHASESVSRSHQTRSCKRGTSASISWKVICNIRGPEGGQNLMQTETVTATQPKTKMFLDIPTAAELAGFSIRHFRRIIEEDQIPIVQIGRKFFILGRDFSTWESAKRGKRPM